jgi:predicted Zn-dependent peptidase
MKHELEIVERSVLPGGLKVVTEQITSVRSCAVGIWVKTGSRNETEAQAGITHFLEHMLFKGTETRSAFDIAQSMEAVGGFLNAFTSNEHTCYYARCLDTELETAIRVLSDMVLHPSFPDEELKKEKKVVIEEMKMYRDSPDDVVFEEFIRQIFTPHPLGRPIIGNEKTVNSFRREDLYSYMATQYNPSNLIVAVAGNADHETVVKWVESAFDRRWEGPEVSVSSDMPPYSATESTLTKKIEQTHMVMGRRALSNTHPDRYSLLLANTVLGGGMSSRLHQNIREKYGYCYAISSFHQAFLDSGIFAVYVGTDQEYAAHVRDLVTKEFDVIRGTLIPEKEFAEAKTQLKGKLLLAQESMNNRMTRLAKSEIYFDRYIPLDELVRDIDAVQPEDVRVFSESFFNPEHFSTTLLVPES